MKWAGHAITAAVTFLATYGYFVFLPEFREISEICSAEPGDPALNMASFTRMYTHVNPMFSVELNLQNQRWGEDGAHRSLTVIESSLPGIKWGCTLKYEDEVVASVVHYP